MKNKKRHSFHGYTLFSRRLNFIEAYLIEIAIDATKVFPLFSGNIFVNLYRFGKCLNAFQYNL
tara:strand:+ start:229 stop:417 length:189 start_codon:yes stop_codon:yes gene_type:complete